MGTDHRGRALNNNHANNINWEKASWGPVYEGSTDSTSDSLGASWYETTVEPTEDNRWSVWGHKDTPYHRCEEGGCRDQLPLVDSGISLTYRTPERAKMAGQALVNRHAGGNRTPYTNARRKRRNADRD